MSGSSYQVNLAIRPETAVPRIVSRPLNSQSCSQNFVLDSGPEVRGDLPRPASESQAGGRRTLWQLGQRDGRPD